MAIPGVIINFRTEQAARDALRLLAKRRGKNPGVLAREWFLRDLLGELALEKVHAVKFAEVNRRLHTPSYQVMEQHEPEPSPKPTQRLVKKL